MKKNKNVYDGAEMVPENVENTHKKGKSLTGRIFRWMCPVSYTHLDVYKRQPVGICVIRTAEDVLLTF